MALTFRNINKICNFYISSRRLQNCRRICSLRRSLLSHEQYLELHTPKCPEVNCRFDVRPIRNALEDNRELLSDFIKREPVFRLENYDKQTKKSSSSLGFSDASKEENLFGTSSQEGKPQPEKLRHVHDVLANDLPNLFNKTFDFTIYHKDIVFEDNIRHIRTKGLYNYAKQVAFLRTVGHFKFAYVNFDILKITQHPEEGTIKVRWRIKGVSALYVMLKFWKVKVWRSKEIIEKSENWYDGFSVFYVNSDGVIFKHVAEKMMPDDDRLQSPAGPMGMGAAKLALIVGVIPSFQI
ncbi:uncharacterized protein C6orf136 homolog [Cylas formicarius]|uniref:uncharacterized protein C6orf136 homolog n=1 Tax=Cylas formicarius TaxID=197179 RepID=UPI002958C7E0|nr:uncharacterized protein C6orf136 homolog [Cylas formicarius]